MAETRSPTSLHLPGFLPYRLATLSNRISRTIAQRYSKRFGLSIPEWRCMAILAEFPEISARQVAERGAMDKVAVSRAVSKLLATGRLERHFSARDRRRSVLALTVEGKEIYRRIVPLAQSYEEVLLKNLSDNEIATLDLLLAKIESLDLENLPE